MKKQRTPLARWMFEKGLSCDDLASLISKRLNQPLTQKAVKNWRSGRSRPSSAALLALRAETGLSTDEILGIPAQEGQS
jgi:hypothetical protein